MNRRGAAGPAGARPWQVLLCLAGPTGRLAFEDAIASGPRHAAENDRRMRLIAARPRLLFIGDLPADPRDWYNRCVVDCFAKRSVVIR